MKVTATLLISLFFIHRGYSQYVQPAHRDPLPGEMKISAPGFYGEQGKTYVLINDISSDRSALFLGKDITLDLNGYAVTFADGNYEHIPDYSFEEGLESWDLSGAPGALVKDTKTQVIAGEHVLSLKKGDEIVSAYVNLPVEDRSYFAMCGVAAPEMKVSIFVEDKLGKTVRSVIKYGAEEIIACPAENISPRLGGGITFAHLYGLEQGKYRIRIKALTDCYIDYVDIRPSLDVGVGIAEEVLPWVNYEHLYNGIHGSFFDYSLNEAHNLPLLGLPVVQGKGTVIIKNGTIRSGTEGILSWGVQSNADNVTIILDNVSIENSGINTNAVDVPQAIITSCTFNICNPFIINRHGSDGYGVDLWGTEPSEVSFSEFYGGQGCLVFKGDFSKVHHNFFANRQSVTNHYSIMAMGDSSLIYDNTIIPETGSGIEIYIHRGMEIFNNEISIVAAPPTCEYGHTDYSTAAIRIADYNAVEGTTKAAFGNKIYNNKIKVTGKDYPEYFDYIPMAWAVFYSSSGGNNYIFGNEITVNDLTPGLKNETSAFYIGGGSKGGIFSGNTITSNVPSFWIASRYGSAENTVISDNLIIKSASAGADYVPIRMGWYKNTAKNIEFRSNTTKGSGFILDRTDNDHSYSVYWTLVVRVTDRKGNAIVNEDIEIRDAKGHEVVKLNTGDKGYAVTELKEYSLIGTEIQSISPYTVISGKERRIVNLNSNQELTINKHRGY